PRMRKLLYTDPVRLQEAEASSAEDRVWAQGACAGDHAAFEALVRKYQSRCVCIARSFVRSEDSARDVAQEAFVRLYRSLHRYDPGQRFYTWLYRIVVHLAIDHLRKNRPWSRARVEAIEREAEAWRGTATPASGLETIELRERVAGILRALPVKYRVLLVLRDVEGFNSKEIAEIAGWNHATVRWRLHRARQLFRAEWAKAGFAEEI
ncbi:MAG: sigma-70 family RNA polymerase sigma factor, partial [Planctomycetes bacterium]|nr:sigma-70 family RNA polymerase sigma factor [Planctomycetota bacterium]